MAWGRESAPVEHGVERRDLVHPHWRHLQQLRDVVHHADARPPLVLPLTEVEQGDDRRLLVLWGVAGDDLVRPLRVLRIELERNLRSRQTHASNSANASTGLGVVVRGVPVLVQRGGEHTVRAGTAGTDDEESVRPACWRRAYPAHSARWSCYIKLSGEACGEHRRGRCEGAAPGPGDSATSETRRLSLDRR